MIHLILIMHYLFRSTTECKITVGTKFENDAQQRLIEILFQIYKISLHLSEIWFNIDDAATATQV